MAQLLGGEGREAVDEVRVARVAAHEGEREDGGLQLADRVVGDELGEVGGGTLAPGGGGLRQELDHGSIFAGAGRDASRAPRIQAVAAPTCAVRASRRRRTTACCPATRRARSAEVASAPRRGEDEPEGERQESREAEGDLEEERLHGPAEDETETRSEGEEGVRRLRDAERGARLRHDGADGAGVAEEGEEAQERQARSAPSPSAGPGESVASRGSSTKRR